ncbi:hypothetical protein JHN63_09995 [Streptomyces sp. MBT65]|uniref:hypothetical protein n=1 Tax=Streptomyces sp. MBT65 TaxID=1488395 RepID=UPI00190E3385|nr:hypothetical protein [Streptomyces sp. MBT65]MBK3574148.1 hypothetical protein [Streptomyces sp. MBT65]
MTSTAAARRRTARRRLRLAALLLPAGLLLTSCGVPASGVVPVGESATGIGRDTMVYFVRDGGLTALPDDGGPDTDLKAALGYPERRADAVQSDAVRSDVELAVWLLAGGPGQVYRAKGVTSEFPSLQWGRPAVRIAGGAVTVELPAFKSPLTSLATRQLLCTVADAFLTVSPDIAPAEVTVAVTGRAVWRADAFDKTCT